MKLVGNILIFLMCSFSVFGQKNTTLSGIFLDKMDDLPIVAGSVELLKAQDSTFVAGAITNANGSFSFKNLASGNYIVKVTYIGYNQFIKNVNLPVNETKVDIGKSYLETNDILLQEAVVEGKRPEVIVKNDTIEYDAGSFKVTENAVVEDLLKKLPGVEIDSDGKITVNGKEVKKFKVDGKDFFSDDPQIASKNLPAEMIEKLQVVDQKSDQARMTGFDDGEEETIINLTIRPGMKRGTMGNALIGAGSDLQKDPGTRYQGGAFINRMQNEDQYTLILGTNNNNNMGVSDLGAEQFEGMRTRGAGGGITESSNFMLRMNKELSSTASLNGDVRYGASDRISKNNVTQTTLSELQSQLDKTNTSTNVKSDNVSANFTFEWKPDTMNTLIFRPNVRYTKSRGNQLEYSSRFDYHTLDTIFDSYSTSKDRREGLNFGGSLDYAHKFNKPGRVISFNARGSYNDNYSHGNSYWLSRQYENNVYSYDRIMDQRSENDNNTNNYRLSFSYVEPFGNNYFLQAFYRYSHADTKSVNSTYDIFEYDPLLALSLAVDTAMLVPEQSRSTLRNSTEQRIGLNVKMVREKYNLTVGFNVDPSNSINETYQPSLSTIFPLYLNQPYDYDSRLANLRGDSLISSIQQDVVNFSPVVKFNYNFGQRTNLRIDYEGRTSQPSANQLRDFVDMTRPTDLVQGNPALKPGYRNGLDIRFNKYVPETQLMYNINFNGNMSFNDITSTTRMLDDGVRLTTYENINGNWDARVRGMFNMPLRNKRFTVGSFAMVNYRNQNSKIDQLENTMRNFMIMNNANANYKSDLFDVGINVSINHNDITYSVRPESNQTTLNWGVGGYTTWYLPANFTIESDINRTARTGYAQGFNIPQVMWNAAITKQLFNKNIGTGSVKLQIYDILQDRNNINASATTNGFRTSEINVIPSYFMCSFIYKFNSFPKSKGSSANSDGGRREGGPPPGAFRGRGF